MMMLVKLLRQNRVDIRNSECVCVDACFEIIKLRNVQKMDHRMRGGKREIIAIREPHSESLN